ncbi:MAG: hypothetical protein NTY74_13600 [Ignavibacteriae bacterium]|nr:hypothetical protein [Ignavibacteriota bacterium]
MGKLFKNVLGDPSGAVGKVVFKERGGNIYIGVRPKPYMPGNGTDAVSRRMKFGLTGKLSTAINSIDKLKIVWDKATPSNITPYNGIFKANYQNVTPTDVSNTMLMAPGVGFKITTSSAEVTNTDVSVTLNALGTDTEIDTMVETTMVMAVVVYCKGVLDPNFKENYFIAMKSSPMNINLVNPLTFSVTLSGTESQMFDKYSTHKGFITFVTLDDLGNPVRFSNTVVH